ncbi:MAG TPA: glycosyltransferase [Actinomycetota bacterium]|nr:glycosyltransferase [Actinomycetota bacterium]
MRTNQNDAFIKPFRVAKYTALRTKRRARRVARRAVRWVRRKINKPKPPSFIEAAWSREIRVAFYVGANLNIIDGSSVWTQSTAEALHADPRLGIVMPMRYGDMRPVITGSLRSLERVALVDSTWFRTYRSMSSEEAIECIRWLDGMRRFDVVILRGFELCLTAARKGGFGDRLWSSYILEPERDVNDPEHIAGLNEIVRASRYIVVQTDGMRTLLEGLVPATAGKTVLLPPAIPSTDDLPFPSVEQRLFYTGKFAPQYPFLELVDIFKRLRNQYPALEFHVAGDKIFRTLTDSSFADAVESSLSSTPGLTWHGGIPRTDVLALLARGGIGLNVWDPAYAHTMNDLVVPSKTLDYCSAGVPVIAQDTSTHRGLFGDDYPLLVSGPPDVEDRVELLLKDEALYRESAERCRDAVKQFTYGAVSARLRPAIDETVAAARAEAAR